MNFIALWSTMPEVGTAGKLLEIVRTVVKPVAVPWLDEGEVGEEKQRVGRKFTRAFREGDYQPLRVKKLKTIIGGSKQTVADPSK